MYLHFLTLNHDIDIGPDIAQVTDNCLNDGCQSDGLSDGSRQKSLFAGWRWSSMMLLAFLRHCLR